MVADAVETEPGRFFDAGDDVEPGDGGDARVELRQDFTEGANGRRRELFQMKRRIGYRDRHHDDDFVVPDNLNRYRTDLTSVPALFTWLVPKSGVHLSAALIHDGLVIDPGQDPQHRGPSVDRVEADRIFRDAMADAGTGVIRRWIVWTAVTLATLWSRNGTHRNAFMRQYYRWIMVATLFSVAWLGYQATADLANESGNWWCTYELPWITGSTFRSELLSGGIWSLLIPIPLSALWLRFWKAGLIACISLAFLFHISIALVLLSAIYVVLEAVVTHGVAGVRRLIADIAGQWMAVLTGAVLIAALIVVCNALG